MRLVVESRASAKAGLWAWRDLPAVKRDLPLVQASAAVDLLMRRNEATAVQLPASVLPEATRVDYLSSERIQTLFGDERPLERAWEDFYETYAGSGALLSFSPVGFSSDASQAVFIVGLACGGLCGRGTGVLMRRSLTGWTVEQQHGVWVS